MFVRSFFLVVASIVAFGGCAAPESASTATEQPDVAATPDPDWPQFSIPIDCTLGEDCFILLYPDRDPTSGVVDFSCGTQTYDTHKGTDFAVADATIMARGIPVLAAAPGRVLRARDGVADDRVDSNEERQSLEQRGIECGNGLVIDHGDGWETQYCHLRNGSLAVEPGTEVERGTVLGLVGMSGLASFPHVHMSVRHEGQVVDPFVGLADETGCQVDRRSMWDRQLEYEPTGLVRAGFSDRFPNANSLWNGEHYEKELSTNIDEIWFWIHRYGVREGDVEQFLLLDPRGGVVTDYEQTVEEFSLSSPSAVGKRNTPDRPILPGTWRGEYRLLRDGEVLIDIDREIEVR